MGAKLYDDPTTDVCRAGVCADESWRSYDIHDLLKIRGPLHESSK